MSASLAMRECRNCEKVYPESKNFFHGFTNKNPGLKYVCKVCSNTGNYYGGLRRRYGLTQESFEKLLQTQSYSCAICEESLLDLPRSHRHVDHCHITGKVRGVLCHHCNTALGGFKDDPELLKRAIEYCHA